MKKLILLLVVLSGVFNSVQPVLANTLLKWEDVASMQINRTSGGTRTFRESDGIEAFVIQKVIEWMNDSQHVKETETVSKATPLALLRIKMKNGDIATVEPAYDCRNQNQTKFCSLADGEVIFTHHNQKLRLKSIVLFDWLLTGWKHERTDPPEDTKELMVHDILMLLLGPEIDKAVGDYYSKSLTYSPMVYPYQVEIVNVDRVGGYRTFHFLITLETTPVVGPHISVGKDRLTFEITPTITPNQIQLKKYEHLETHELPPHWQDIIKEKAR